MISLLARSSGRERWRGIAGAITSSIALFGANLTAKAKTVLDQCACARLKVPWTPKQVQEARPSIPASTVRQQLAGGSSSARLRSKTSDGDSDRA